MTKLPAYINDVPNISGSEDLIASARNSDPVFLPTSKINWDNVKSAFAIALHMHQPIIPNPDQPLKTADVISNLEHMMNHLGSGDNHNAQVFHQCYKRMGDFIPELLEQGAQPRCMFDYSGVLLHGLHKMGLNDVFENLGKIFQVIIVGRYNKLFEATERHNWLWLFAACVGILAIVFANVSRT